jgi:hypothetical protein
VGFAVQQQPTAPIVTAGSPGRRTQSKVAHVSVYRTGMESCVYTVMSGPLGPQDLTIDLRAVCSAILLNEVASLWRTRTQ